MRLLRDLPIAWKLFLSAAAGFALLGVLTWHQHLSAQRLAALDVAAAAAGRADVQVQSALRSAGDMAAATREMLYQQAPGAVSHWIGRARAGQENARAVLAALRDAETQEAGRQAIGAAVAQLDEYVAQAHRVEELRRDMLKVRDAEFLAIQPSFDQELQSMQPRVLLEDVSPSELEELRTTLGQYADSYAEIRTATLRFLATGDAQLEGKVLGAAGMADSYIGRMQALRISAMMKDDLDGLDRIGRRIQEAAGKLFRAQEQLVRQADGPLDAASRALDERLAQLAALFGGRDAGSRAETLAAQEESRRSTLLLSGGLAVLLLLSGLLTARAVSRPIRALTRDVQRIVAGDTAFRVQHRDRRDEVGCMAQALEGLREAAAKAFLQAQVIEQSPTGVMLCDPTDQFRITYMNAESRRLAGLLEQHLPVKADALVGQSIDVFHRRPEHQRTILSDPSNLPHRTRIAVGGETMELVVTALRDAKGAYAGPVLTWKSLTAQVRLAERFEQSVGAVVGTLGSSAGGMARMAEGMEATAGTAGARATQVAAASTQASASVESVAATAEELAQSVAEIARQVADSAGIAAQAVQEAQATDRSVAGLNQAAARIGDVVRLIGDIAARTNLLALNATIEAARAGDAGRGFAVVAGEVKTLANQTAKATEEIAGQISAMQAETAEAVAALGRIGATIGRLDEISTAIAGAVEEQGAATGEIARAVQQAAAGTQDVSANIAEASAEVARTGAEARNVLQAAGQVSAQAGTLRQEVDTFLGALRNAG